MAMNFYDSLALELATGIWNWDTNTIHLVLTTTTYAFVAGHSKRSSITNEVTGTNYTAGGKLLANTSATAANPTVMSADDQTYAQSGAGFANARNYVVTKFSGTPANDNLWAHGVAGADFGNQAGLLTLDIPLSWFTLSTPHA
jgi:hypothetical protein